MGNFYVNYSIRGIDEAEVCRRIPDIASNAYLNSSAEGWLCLVTPELDQQDFDVINAYGRSLSMKHAEALFVLNHDDDFIVMGLFKDGKSVAYFHSDPGYFDESEDDAPTLQGEGDFAQVCATASVEDVRALLLDDEEFVFGIDLHNEIVALLGLSKASLAAGYSYVQQGDAEGDWKKSI